jgi:ribonuclease BN (tRNA processing enzyme)
MQRLIDTGLRTAVLLGILAFGNALAASCGDAEGVTLQVLGSGGPIADDGRASTGYLLWIDGQSRVLVDAGGGTFLRFGEAGAKFEDLDFVGLSHLHTDHSADFPALIKSGNFSPRTRPLPIAGPDGDGPFPGLNDFLTAMFGRDRGAYAYLASFLDGTNNKPVLTPREVPVGETTSVYTSESLSIDALQVPHGIVPAVAFRVTAGDTTWVFASDQNGSDPAFTEFAKGATVLVMHLVIPEGAEGVVRKLHAPPSVIGDIAATAAPGKLVLSHFMARGLKSLDDSIALVRGRYKGEIVLAEDLACISP